MTHHFDLLALAGELAGSHPWALPILKISLLLAVGWILHGLLRARNPRWRILLWRGAAVGTLVIALLAFIEPLVSLNWLPAAPQAEIASSPPPPMFENPPIEPMRPLPEPPVYSPPAVLPRDAAPMASPVAPMESEVAPVAEGWPVEDWVIGIWSVGFVVLGLRTLVAVLRLSGIRRQATQIPEWLHADANALFADVRGITICHSAQIPAPCSVGIFRPLILLPTALCHERHREELRAAIAHEAAHFAGRDLIWNWILHVMILVGWFHPLAWRIRLAHADACDERCDAEAAQRLGDTANYTRSLARIALSIHPTQTPMVMTMARQSTIRRRLEMLAAALGQRKLPPTRAWSVVLLAALVTLTVGTVGITQSTAEEERTSKTSETDKPELTTEKATAPPEATFIKKVRVVDSNGKPVVGAEVEPWGIRYQGGHGSWENEHMGRGKPPTLKTDAEGEVTINVPLFADPGEELPPWQLSCRVTHPAFAETISNDVAVTPDDRDKTTNITVQSGAVVEVVALRDGQRLPPDHLYALTESHAKDGVRKLVLNSDGKIVVPRLPEGKDLIRLAFVPRDEPPLFSELKELDLRNGQTLSLTFDMRPSVQVSGEIDASIPRPIKNGSISAWTINYANDDERSMAFWINTASIREDGSFILEDVPEGDLQVTALCEGFIASNGERPDFALDRDRIVDGLARPQVFKIAPDQNSITIKMRPLGTARVHLRDPNGSPVTNAEVHFWPNVMFWRGGSTIYGSPAIGMSDYIRSAERKWGNDNIHFRAFTNDDGMAAVELPPGHQSFTVVQEKWELPSLDSLSLRMGTVTVTAGQTTDITIDMQPKGTEPIPALESQPEVDDEPLLTAQGDQLRTSVAGKPKATRTFDVVAEGTELAGVVVDEMGQPLEGVTVDAWTWHPGNETTTDMAGRFSLKGFEPRDQKIQVEFTKEGFSPSLFIAQPVGTDNWVIVLTQGNFIAGTLTDSRGLPVPNATIRAKRGPFQNPNVVIGEVFTDTKTDENGQYHLNLEPDTYEISARVPNVGAVRQANVTLARKEEKQLNLQLDKGTTLHAIVRDSVTQQPVKGIILWNWRQPDDIEGVSDENGVIEIPGLFEGEMGFNVTSDQTDRRKSSVAGQYARWWSAQAKNEWEQLYKEGETFQRNFDYLTFDITGETYEVEIFVEPLVTITGKVLDPDGEPVAGATVSAAKTGSGNSLTGDTRFSYETDENGRFEVKLPASGEAEYNLIVQDGKYGQWRTWANGSGEPFQTRPGEVISDVELRLTRPGSVEGRVTDAQGKPLANIEVRAFPTDGKANRYYVPTTKTDAEGRYALKFVAPGESFIQIEPFWLDPKEGPTNSSHSVTVKTGETTEVNFTRPR